MSRQAQDYLTEHLPEIRRATFTDPGKSTGTRAIGENGLALLVFLCDATNKAGEFFMSARAMQEGAGIATIREVRRLLAGFIELGWITPTGETVSYQERGRATPVYALTLVPGIHKPRAIGVPNGVPNGVPGDTRKTADENVEPLQHKAHKENTAKSVETEPEPKPEPRSEPEPAGDWGDEHEQLLADILKRENMTSDRGALRPWLVSQYRPIVIRALKSRPTTDLVTWCMNKRKGRTETIDEYWPYKADPDDPGDCEHGCKGAGQFVHIQNGREQGLRTCVCAGGTLSLLDPDTPPAYEPPPNAQPELLKALTQKMRRI